eukprot:Selendium_serpulae@DN2616_c0_g2_i1.p1
MGEYTDDYNDFPRAEIVNAEEHHVEFFGVRGKQYVSTRLVYCRRDKLCVPEASCGVDLSPVCGSDGVTYWNECLVDAQRDQCNATLTFQDGPCEEDEVVGPTLPPGGPPRPTPAPPCAKYY